MPCSQRPPSRKTAKAQLARNDRSPRRPAERTGRPLRLNPSRPRGELTSMAPLASAVSAALYEVRVDAGDPMLEVEAQGVQLVLQLADGAAACLGGFD